MNPNGTYASINKTEDASTKFNLEVPEASYSIEWKANGTEICTASYDQYSIELCSDGLGGVIITWMDYRSGINDDIYAQRIDSNGIAQWPAIGVAICTADGNDYSIEICDDANGRVIACWASSREDKNYDIYAQRVELEMKEEVPIYSLCLDIIKQYYSEEEFNLTFYLYNASNSNQSIEWGDRISWSIWWKAMNVSADIIPLVGGNYSISLEKLIVSPGEDYIRLNGTILAVGFKEKNFEYFIAVDPEVIDKAPGPAALPSDGGDNDDEKAEEPAIPVGSLVAIGIGSVIAAVAVVLVFLKKRGLSKRESE